ncbi:hypothetical protein [Novispirillum itersonii]|uniref:hypothetical protein n=1 Tax=Novispirillum itersonii TaxID=189 RepID=UPI00036405BC|nr:hypothetical protein [Novispirillum itersonii]
MKPLSPTLKSIARHILSISWSSLLDTISMLITGTGLTAFLALLALIYIGSPLTVQITAPSGQILLSSTSEIVKFFWEWAALCIGGWLFCMGIYMSVTGHLILMTRTFQAMDAAFSDLIRHVPALTRLARLARMRKERKG